MKYGQGFLQEKSNRIMRVLHLPVNTASIPSHTVRGLCKIGIDARGLVYGSSRIQSFERLKVIGSNAKPARYSIAWFLWVYNFFRWTMWADVIHWYCGASALLPFDLDILFLRLLRKSCIVEWLGSDIRISEIEIKDNPYFRSIVSNLPGYGRAEKSYKKQTEFAKAGFVSIVSVGMLRYIKPDTFQKIFIVPQRLVLSDYQPVYPDPNKIKPILVHSPSNPVIKGTQRLINVIEKLQKKYEFDFKLVSGIPREENLKIIQKADIYLDQFIIGDYGMAALEAMALGKPVLCYIKPSIIEQYPADFPVVNANLDNLESVLEPLINDGKLRNKIGKLGRKYVEKYHDAEKIAKQLVRIYNELKRR